MPTGPLNGIDILFVAGFGPITRAATQEQSRQLYQDTLRLPLQSMDEHPGYLHSDRIDGVKHLALWPLTQASQSCFGIDDWPEYLPIPQCWLELEAADLDAATAALKAAGHTLLVEARQEPWGQTVTRLLSPEGILLGLTHTPWLRTPPS